MRVDQADQRFLVRRFYHTKGLCWFCSVGEVPVVISDLMNKWEADNVAVDSDGVILWVRAFGRLEEGFHLLD